MICNRLTSCYKATIDTKEPTNCPNLSENCITIHGKDSNVKCSENGKVYVLSNTLKRHVVKYKVDGGVIKEDASVPEGTNKCDFLYLVKDNSIQLAILIELKGKSIKKAIKQLTGTLVLYPEFFKNFTRVYCRIIVTSSTPNIKADPSYIKLITSIKKLNGNIKISEKKMNEKDIELDVCNNPS